MQTITVLREQYDQQYNCITIEELRWLLRKARRHTAMYTMLLLGLTTGMRCSELLNLTLFHFSPDFRSINYAINKPKQHPDGDTVELTRKHRRVTVDPWVAKEIKAYCDLHFIIIHTREGPRYCSPHRDLVPNRYGDQYSQKLFPWKSTVVFDAGWWKYRKALGRAGFDADRLECLTKWMVRHKQNPTYVVRFHKLRHMYATIEYYRNGKDIKAVQRQIKHSRTQTTDGYIHTADEMGSTPDFLLVASWAEICGFRDDQESLTNALAPEQTILGMFD